MLPAPPVCPSLASFSKSLCGGGIRCVVLSDSWFCSMAPRSFTGVSITVAVSINTVPSAALALRLQHTFIKALLKAAEHVRQKQDLHSQRMTFLN